ncbi:HAD family hydrolase [Candidatus Bipolaricaulota bacterium]
MMKPSRELEAVVWDFNGTLIDDLDLVVRAVNVQLEKRGLPRLTPHEYREVFGFPVEDYYRRIGLDFRTESMAELAAGFFKEYAPGLPECPLHEGVIEAIAAFAKRSIRQFVLSAMEEEMLHNTLEVLGIRDHFVAAYGLAHQEGDSKISRGRQLLADHSICPEETLMIGDTDHDAEVAAELGMSAVLVSTGHQSAPRLQATGQPVYGSLRALACE